jgi:hypothetical protein
LENGKNCWSWLGNLDSNQDKQSQSLLCYRYTIPQWIVEQVQLVMKLLGNRAAGKSPSAAGRRSTRSLQRLASPEVPRVRKVQPLQAHSVRSGAASNNRAGADAIRIASLPIVAALIPPVTGQLLSPRGLPRFPLSLAGLRPSCNVVSPTTRGGSISRALLR